MDAVHFVFKSMELLQLFFFFSLQGKKKKKKNWSDKRQRTFWILVFPMLQMSYVLKTEFMSSCLEF